ncbi:MAG: hypothetical protein C0599_17455 [Salinivirgaceae bacterium]|nr:MAG: hypothetical protein C0599_17455 [Salinivirgaceae bacterium]
MHVEKHKVILTGIGPGDPELLTVKAFKAIKAADVIIYDSEQADRILDIAGENTEIVKINKDRSIPYNEQAEQIVGLIENHYAIGEKVVRLKVGDAFLFGRGGTEALKMKSRGIDFEVIPGITSGIAASNTKRIKISEKNEADGVVFYMANQKEEQSENLKSIANNLINGFTLVAYMAEGRITQIAQDLMKYGVSSDIKVTAASNISTANEMIKSGELKEVAEREEWNRIEPQTIFYIGKYVDVI